MNPFKHFIHTLLKLSTVLDHYAKYNWVLNPSAFCTINEPKIRLVLTRHPVILRPLPWNRSLLSGQNPIALAPFLPPAEQSNYTDPVVELCNRSAKSYGIRNMYPGDKIQFVLLAVVDSIKVSTTNSVTNLSDTVCHVYNAARGDSSFLGP